MTVIHAKRKAHTTTQETEELVEVGIRYSCDQCFRDISAIPRIQCAECGTAAVAQDQSSASSTGTAAVAAEEVDLCVECFAKGVEFGQHKKTHSYRIIRPLDFCLYEREWRADEELLLLEAVEANGMGNWREIADQVASKTAQECESHYRRLYLDWPGRPLPNPEYRVDPKTTQASRGRSLDEMLPKKRMRREPSVDLEGGAVTQQSQPANHEITGYMPGRLDFETEWENEAETVVKEIGFQDDDTPFDTQLKLAVLDIYLGALEGRRARRDFAHQHNLIDFRRYTATDKARSREERDLLGHLKPFARLVSSTDLQKLLEGLVREEELRRRIAQLQEYRRNGLRSFDQVSAYESEKKHLELYLKGGTMPASQQQQQLTAAAGSAAPAKLVLSAREPFPLPHSSNSHGRQPTSFSSSLGSMMDLSMNGSRKASMPLNIAHAEGIELLGEKEREICSILRLYPRLYLSIKDTLIRECLRLGGLKRAQARASVKIDVNKTSKLYDFFITAGWIKPPASGE